MGARIRCAVLLAGLLLPWSATAQEPIPGSGTGDPAGGPMDQAAIERAKDAVRRWTAFAQAESDAGRTESAALGCWRGCAVLATIPAGLEKQEVATPLQTLGLKVDPKWGDRTDALTALATAHGACAAAYRQAGWAELAAVFQARVARCRGVPVDAGSGDAGDSDAGAPDAGDPVASDPVAGAAGPEPVPPLPGIDLEQDPSAATAQSVLLAQGLLAAKDGAATPADRQGAALHLWTAWSHLGLMPSVTLRGTLANEIAAMMQSDPAAAAALAELTTAADALRSVAKADQKAGRTVLGYHTAALAAYVAPDIKGDLFQQLRAALPDGYQALGLPPAAGGGGGR